jgi:hypothetical protein
MTGIGKKRARVNENLTTPRHSVENRSILTIGDSPEFLSTRPGQSKK